MMNNLDLSIIILSYNTKDVTLRCLEKLKVSKEYCENRLKNNVEVMVLDNNSEDGSVGVIREFRGQNKQSLKSSQGSDYKWVKLLESKTNLGFSKGNNKVLQKTKKPYILLLNSDVYLEEDSLYKALAYFRVNLNCDVLGGKLKYPDGRLQPSSGNLPTPINTVFWILGISNIPLVGRLTCPFHPTFNSFFNKAHQVGWVSGAFFMLKRQVFEKTSGFDENIFMYAEEVEWCKRIQDKGFQVWYVPQIEVIHLHGASSNFDMRGQYVNELKGVKYYLIKHHPVAYPPIKLILVLGILLRVIAFAILGKTKRARAYYEVTNLFIWKG